MVSVRMRVCGVFPVGAVLAPVAGLGMCVLVLGLPRPVRAPLGSRRGRGGFPAALVAGHGLFVLVSLLFVLLATIAAS